MAVDLIFCTEFIFVLHSIIGSQENRSLHVSNENGSVSFDNLSLHLKAIIWIQGIDNPNTIIVWHCCRCTCYLLLRNWGSDCCRVFVAAQAKLFPEEILVGLDAHFLSIPYEFIATEHVDFVNTLQFIDRTGHWTWVLSLARTGYLVCFRNVGSLIADIEDQPSLRILVLDHDRVAPPKVAIGVVGPWNLSVRLLILA